MQSFRTSVQHPPPPGPRAGSLVASCLDDRSSLPPALLPRCLFLRATWLIFSNHTSDPSLPCLKLSRFPSVWASSPNPWPRLYPLHGCPVSAFLVRLPPLPHHEFPGGGEPVWLVAITQEPDRAGLDVQRNHLLREALLDALCAFPSFWIWRLSETPLMQDNLASSDHPKRTPETLRGEWTPLTPSEDGQQ